MVKTFINQAITQSIEREIKELNIKRYENLMYL